MTLVIRKLNKKRRWELSSTDFDWLGKNDLIGSVFDCIKPNNSGELSVFLTEDESQIISIVTALAIGRDSRSDGDFVAIDRKVLDDAGFQLDNESGRTPDETVNNLHFNIIKLSANELLRLANVFKEEGTFDKVPWKNIAKNVAERIDNNIYKSDVVKIVSEQFWIEVEKHQKSK